MGFRMPHLHGKWLYPLSQFTDPCYLFYETRSLSHTETVFYNLTRLTSQWVLGPACLHNFITLAFHINSGDTNTGAHAHTHISSSSLLSVGFIYALHMCCSTAQVHYTLVKHALGRGHLWNSDIATTLPHLLDTHRNEVFNRHSD